MRFIIATHNPHKLEELRRILRPLGVDAVCDRDLGLSLTEAEETGATFAENAYLKAAAACRESGLPAVADDSGLCVDALSGAPGVYSARYAEPGQRKATLLHRMEQVPEAQRGAHFTSAVCCVFPNGDTVTAEGHCYGRIARACRGEGGFGYDPIFEVEGGKTFAELTDAKKDAVSHRGAALRKFAGRLAEYLNTHKESISC